MNTYNPFTQFRSEVYQNFNKRADSLLELVDALSSHQHARSVAELSLADGFHYGYSALYKSIAACSLSNQQLAHLAAPYIPQPERRNFWLLAQDVSSHPRLYAECLHDRGYVYEPTVIRGHKPVTIGHQYAIVVALPEKEAADAAWVIPLSTARVASTADKELVGAELLHKLLTDPEMPFYGELCVTVQDSSYRKPAYLHAQARHPN